MKTTLKKMTGWASLGLLGIFLFYSPPPAAAATSSIAIFPSSNAVTVGQAGTISVNVSNAQASVYAIQFTMTYDPTVITITSVAPGSNMAGCVVSPTASTLGSCNMMFNINQPGTAQVGLFFNNALAQPVDASSGQPTPQQIAVVNFTVNAAAAGKSTTLTLTQSMLNETAVTPSNTGTITATAANTAPTWNLSAQQNEQVTAGQTVTLNLPAATPAQSGDTLTYAVSGLPSWATFNSANLLLTLSPLTTTAAGSTTLTFTVTDATTGGTASQSITVTVAAGSPVSGACGSANHTYLYQATSFGSDTLCKSGNPFPTTVTFPAPGASVQWTCQGINGGLNRTCKARRNSRVIFRL